MDIRLQTAIIAAIVSVIAALLTPWVKNRFDKQARTEEWARKRDDWFLEKQARDTEEIIAALNSFLKVLSDDIGRWNALTVEAVDSVFRDSEAKPANIQQNSSHFAKNKWLARTWFGYDSLRLSVWFRASTEIVNRLNELGVEFAALYRLLEHSTYALQGTANSSQLEDDEAYDRAAAFITSMQESIAGQSQRLVDKAASIQRELVNGLRGT